MSTLALIADRSEMGGGDFLVILIVSVLVSAGVAVWLGGRR